MLRRPIRLRVAVPLVVAASLVLNVVLWFTRNSTPDSTRSRVFIYDAGCLDGAPGTLGTAASNAQAGQVSPLTFSASYLGTHQHVLRLPEHEDVLPEDAMSLASAVADLLLTAHDDDIPRLSYITGKLAKAHRQSAGNVSEPGHPDEGPAAVIEAAPQDSGGRQYLARYGDLPPW